MSDLVVANVSGGETEYKIDLFAFDSVGNLLTKSAEYGIDALFILPDGVVLAEDLSQRSGVSSRMFSQEDINSIARNGGRFEAADLLIQDNLYDQAEAILNKVEGKAEPGRLLALRGYLQASKGNCTLANGLFQSAIDEAGNHCILERYRVDCGY